MSVDREKNALFMRNVLEEARRRHIMQLAGAGPLLLLAETRFADECMLRDWPALIDGE